MGPQQAVAGGGTYKSGGGTDKAIHAILFASFTQVLHLWATQHSHMGMLRCRGNVACETFTVWNFHNVKLSHCSYFSISHFVDYNFRYFWFIVLAFFNLVFFHSGRMAKFVHGQSEACSFPWSLYVHTHKQTIHSYTHTRINTWTKTRRHVHAWIHTHTHACMCVHACMYLQTWMQMLIHVYTHAHTYTYSTRM